MSEFEARKDKLLEDLSDLEHDLGKYIVLPISFLPKDAGKDEILDAVRRALTQTQVKAARTLSAKAIWDGFQKKWSILNGRSESYKSLCSAVDRALGLKEELDLGRERIERGNVQRILGNVREQIEIVIEEVESGRD
jgi:hypothetical protein